MSITFSNLSALIFMAAVVAVGIWLFRIKRYHIFYFSLCGLLLLDLILFFLFYAMSMTKNMDYKLSSNESYFSDFNILGFTNTIARISFFLVLILSLINPFIRKNKLSVKITSIIMLVICGFVIYQLIAEFSHPVMKTVGE